MPIYAGLFGCDTLTAAWQAALLSTQMLRGTLPSLAALQGRQPNDWRDEQPGRMLHEARTGPLAVLNYKPSRALLRLHQKNWRRSPAFRHARAFWMWVVG